MGGVKILLHAAVSDVTSHAYIVYMCWLNWLKEAMVEESVMDLTIGTCLICARCVCTHCSNMHASWSQGERVEFLFYYLHACSYSTCPTIQPVVWCVVACVYIVGTV